MCHAEMNAILNKNSESVRDCIIYVGLFPFNECTKIIIESGINLNEVHALLVSVKHKDKNSTIASKGMLDRTKVMWMLMWIQLM